MTTGPVAMPLAADSKPIGQPHGGAIVAATPKTADEAADMAIALVGTSLPLSVQMWLSGMESAELLAVSIGYKPPVKPELTTAERHHVAANMKSLSSILEPAYNRGPELDVLIGKLFAAFNVFTGDEGKLRAQMSAWAEKLESYPLYALRKAYKRAIKSEGKLPSLAWFVAATKVAVGDDVLKRQRLVNQLLAGR